MEETEACCTSEGSGSVITLQIQDLKRPEAPCDHQLKYPKTSKAHTYSNNVYDVVQVSINSHSHNYAASVTTLRRWDNGEGLDHLITQLSVHTQNVHRMLRLSWGGKCHLDLSLVRSRIRNLIHLNSTRLLDSTQLNSLLLSVGWAYYLPFARAAFFQMQDQVEANTCT